MAEDDEIDILGDFSFNSCFAQNNQGIPSCSDREDTVHPQWLLDSTANNWYDTQRNNSIRFSDGSPKKLTGNSSRSRCNEMHTSWTQMEKDLLVKEMAKYGRNVRKISQTLKTKTEAEIQALIEAEYGVYLETPSFGLEKHEDLDNVPSVVQEEIVTDEVSNILDMVATGQPTVNIPPKTYRKKLYKSKLSISKQNAFNSNVDLSAVNPSEILYEDDLIVGSIESVGSDLDSTDMVSRSIMKQHRERIRAMKKIGNHRRKVSRSRDRRGRNKSKDNIKSPQGRQRKDSSLSEESIKSPKMQIVFSSGQALPLSEGEQVIKIEKKKDSDSESDIDIDIDSDNEVVEGGRKMDKVMTKTCAEDAPVAAPPPPPLRKFEPMPKRQKKINLDGGGGYTIMHTEAGDLYAIGAEPRRERAPKKTPVHLIQCHVFNMEKPAPYEIRMNVSALIAMDVHAHTSRAEVMGLMGGHFVNTDKEHNISGYIHNNDQKLTDKQDKHASVDEESSNRTVLENILSKDAEKVKATNEAKSMQNVDNNEELKRIDNDNRKLPTSGDSCKDDNINDKVAKSDAVHENLNKISIQNSQAVNLKQTPIETFVQSDLHIDIDAKEINNENKDVATSIPRLEIRAYRPAAAAACGTHCDMDPVSQASCAERLHSLGLRVCAWHHSHPQFPAAPSLLDLRSQLTMQRALEREARPMVALITSQHWPHGRSASHYRCFRVEEPEPPSDVPVGFQFSVKLVPDLTEDNLDSFVEELKDILKDESTKSEYSVDMIKDVCPQAGLSYLEKCISSIIHHMHSAGYEDGHNLTRRLVLALRDIFR